MEQRNIGICLFVTLCFISFTGGTVCSRLHTWYSSHWICVKRSWWWGHRCLRHKWVYRIHYRTDYYCCPGWRGSVNSGCTQPICRPECRNGGTCYRPNRCRCQDGTAGDTCQDITCSFRKPCFPGTCSYSNNCNCQNGFQNHGWDDKNVCLKLDTSQKPTVTKCTATLANIRRSDKTELYRYITDSTSPNVSTIDRIWINLRDFNYLNLYFEAMYMTPDDLQLLVPPSFVDDYKFGITGGNSHVTLTKIPREGGSPFVSQNILLSCPYQPSSTNPVEGLFKCNITDANFDRLLEHGDNLTVTVTANNGGFRKLLRSNGVLDTTQSYVGQSSEKKMVFHFDFFPPKHCSEDPNGCNEKPLEIDEDITKKPIQLMWGGWSDLMAGIDTYTLEIFKLVPDMYSGYLREEDSSNPIITRERNASNNILNYRETFSPNKPGMYSFVLGTNDAANNTRYCRRVALFDPVSEISISYPPKFIVSSAAKDTNYSWQSNINDGSGNGVLVSVSWEGHFMNKLHKDEKLLNKVLPFKTIKLPTNKTKSVDDTFEDKDGNRTLNSIVNVNGIVNFEITHSHDHNGGSTLGDKPDKNIKWTQITNVTSESFSFKTTRVDGDTLRIWVRAYDAIGDTKVDYTDVSFDSTPPIIEEVKLQRNKENSTYPFGSRLEMITLDKESGINKIKWRLRAADGNKIFREGAISGNETDKCSSRTICDSIPTGQAFNYLHHLDIDNCWMVVEKEKLDTQVITLEIESFNMAMISNGTQLQIKNLRSFSGMEDYSGPLSVKLVKKSANGAQLKWEQSPSCYDRSDIEIVCKPSTGSVRVLHVHNAATSYDVFGLDPETNYTIEIYNIYGSQRSNPVKITFITPEAEGLSAGGIAGIVIVMLILVGIIVAGVVMWRTGRLNVAKENIQRKMTVRRVKRKLRQDDKFNNVAYQDCSDDIYIYGGMEASNKQNWYIPSSEVVLEEKITSGRFADIYKAKRQIKQNNRSTVVAKILHENFSDQDEFIMKAKMNFFATVVGSHPNVLEFIGGVIDHPSLGQFMLFEYCDEGTLKSWLDQKKQERIGDDIFERLCRISFDIAKGLEHLAKKKIVHRRLAARNILLTSQLEAKVAGFGPSLEQSDGNEDNELNNKKERVPVKWMAPECMESTKHANEASDVWSYGIVLWEMFSLGESPYPNMRSRDVPGNVKDGHRMERPEFADDVHYDLMKRCWHKKPKSRPNFQQIALELANTFTSVPSDECYYLTEN